VSIKPTSSLPKLNNNFRLNNFSSFAKGGETITITMKGQSPEAHAQAILDKFKFSAADEKKFKEKFGYDLRQTLTESYRNKDDKTSHKPLGNGLYQTTIPIDKKLLAQIREIKPETKQQAKVKVQTKSTSSPSNPNETIAGKNGVSNAQNQRANLEQLLKNAQVLKSVFGEPTKLTDLKHFDVKEINVPNYGKEDNALAALIEKKYGGGNLWADKQTEILQITKSNGVKVENLKSNGNGTVGFDLSVENVLKLQHAYIGVQEKFNVDEAKINETIDNLAHNKFAKGVVDGAWEDLKANWKMVTNPWQTFKDVASGAWELGKIGVELAAMDKTDRIVLFGKLAEAGIKGLAEMPISEAAYKLGKLVGAGAVELALGKGVGAGLKALRAISGMEMGKTLMSSAIEMSKKAGETLGNIPIPKGVKVVEIATTTGEKLRFPTFETAKLGEITKAMESRALQMLDGVKKAVNLPSWEKLTIDLDHVLSGHKTGGSRLTTSTKMGGKKDIFPEWMNDKQIVNAIKEAYKNAKKIKTQKFNQGKVITLEGTSNNLKIRIHVNVDLMEIESAYPVKGGHK
jgi:Bacterial EndoU nuclease